VYKIALLGILIFDNKNSKKIAITYLDRVDLVLMYNMRPKNKKFYYYYRSTWTATACAVCPCRALFCHAKDEISCVRQSFKLLLVNVSGRNQFRISKYSVFQVVQRQSIPMACSDFAVKRLMCGRRRVVGRHKWYFSDVEIIISII